MDRNFLDRRRHIQDLVFEEKQSIFISESTPKAGLESTVSVISADTGLFPEYRVLLSRKCQTTLILEKAMAEEEAVTLFLSRRLKWSLFTMWVFVKHVSKSIEL